MQFVGSILVESYEKLCMKVNLKIWKKLHMQFSEFWIIL